MLHLDKMLLNRSLLSLALGLLLGSAIGSAPFAHNSAPASPALSDSLYRARHPHLLFTQAEIPDLKQKVRDGGPDDDAFDYIGFLVDSVYIRNALDTVNTYSLYIGDMANLGIAAHLGSPSDSVAADLGWRLTYFIADRFEPDDNTYYSPLRARALSLG